MKIYNIDSFEVYKKYYNFYTENNSKLNNIIQNIIQKYTFVYDPEKYYRLNEKNMVTRNIYELSGITIMLNAIIEKNMYGYCIKTGNKYKCEKMHCCNSGLTKYMSYTYHFNCSGDEFIIMFSWEYFSPILICYTKTSEIYNISYRYSDITQFINLLKNINYNITYYPTDNYVSYVVGIMHNAGHYFWNEICGLMILIENNLVSNIDEFIIYNFDYLNIGNMLKSKFNKKITYLASENNNRLTLNLSKHYITNSLIETFKNNYELKNNNNINEINIIFDIRTNDRIWLNQIPIIINIMNWIKNTYHNYSVNFFIGGFYNYEQNNTQNTIYNSKKEISQQTKIFNIIKNFVSFPIYSLINLNLSQIIKICQRIDLCICNSGSGIGFFYQTIFNKDTICFTLNKKTYDFDLQRYAFENYVSNSIFLESKYIIDSKEGNFNIKPQHLLPLVINKLNNIIKNKQE